MSQLVETEANLILIAFVYHLNMQIINFKLIKTLLVKSSFYLYFIKVLLERSN